MRDRVRSVSQTPIVFGKSEGNSFIELEFICCNFFVLRAWYKKVGSRSVIAHTICLCMLRIFKHLNWCTNAYPPTSLSLNTKMSFQHILKPKFTFQLWSKEAVVNAVKIKVLLQKIKTIYFCKSYQIFLFCIA